MPASKSISNRILLMNALSKNPQRIFNLSESDDTQALKSALDSNKPEINIGAAGTSMRFLTAYLAQLPGEYLLTGSKRMENRPIGVLVDALREIGADIHYINKECFPPLKIRGKELTGGTVRLQGDVSSQYISAMMMIAPCTKQGMTIVPEGELISEPYIRMTESLMKQFGIAIIRKGNTFRIEPQTYHTAPVTIERDWSAASYMYEIIALSSPGSTLTLSELAQESLQGDAKVASLFERLGVRSDFRDFTVRLTKTSEKQSSFSYDFTNEPDLAQTFIVTCCLLEIPFRFSGLQSLRIKETDRIVAMQKEMEKLGYLLKLETGPVLTWDGKRCAKEENPVISTYEDHRMAMAFAPAALQTGIIRIADPEVVNKSYPAFWDDLKSLGFRIEASSH